MTKRVLFIATVTGHILTFHIPYLQWFKEHGYEVHVASNGEKTIEYCDKHFNLPFARFPLKPQNYKVYKQLKEIINKNNYEIIHCHTPVGGVLGRLAAKKARKKGTKVIYTAHGFHFYKGAPLINWLIYYPLEKIMAKHTDCLITITDEDYKLAKRRLKHIKQIEHINGVGFNTQRFNLENFDKEKLKKELNIDKDEIVLTYVGELNKNKNQELLINVIEDLKANNRKIKLLLVGEGSLKEQYEKLIQEKKLENSILLLGARSDVPQLLSITNVYVAPSIREGLPVNIMEAMYMGLPIVATDNRGHRELVENSKNGFIVNTQKEMKEKIELILNDKELIQRFKTNGKEKSKKYEINCIINEMKNIYNRNT